MKSVLMSIKPKYCELIANGKKTIEVRKNRPKLEIPFKCYIYCPTSSYKGKYLHTSNKRGRLLFWKNPNDTNIIVQPENYNYMAYTCRGKVIGEFICDGIISHCEMANADIAEQQGKIKREDLLKYANGKELYGWHISDLKVYDKPKELKRFGRFECEYCGSKKECFAPETIYYCSLQRIDTRLNNNMYRCDGDFLSLKRPPRSWCYVEELEG